MSDLLQFFARAPLEPALLAGAGLLAAIVVPRWLRPARRRDYAERPLRALASDLDPSVVCVADAKGELLFLSDNADNLLGEPTFTASTARSAQELLRPDDPAGLRTALRAWERAATPLRVEVRARTAAGGRWLEVWGRRLGEADPARMLLEVRDVTARKAEDEAFRMVSGALEATPDPILITDVNGVIVQVNPAYERLSGYARSELVGQRPSVLKSGRHRPEFYQRLWTTILAGRPFRAEFTNRRRDGELYVTEQVIAPVRGADGTITHFVSTGRDVSERKRIESELEERAYYDSLTGLPSQRLFRERAKQALALARRHGHTAAVLYADLDGFGAVNSTHGRGVGDQLLKNVAERLRQSTRESDALARVAADEFVVLLSEVSDEDAIGRVARRIRDALGKPFQIGDVSVRVTASVGIAVYPQDAGNYQELLTLADMALDRARVLGSGFEFYRPELSVHTREQLSLEEDLRWASERDQFVLHYQPIVAVESGAMVGAEALARGQLAGLEALARWPHFERGMMPPAEFIPLAERTGKIVSLDRWAISAAVRQASQWAGHGWRGWVSVNLSARSLQDPDLPGYVGRVLEAHQLAPQRLVLEITESAAMRDPESTARVLDNLSRVGARVAVDDFGIGHSSLAYLKHFPVDLLKLDQTFIHDIGTDPKDERLIEVMITLAHRIGAQIIAEGVEEERQLLWLRAAGCDMVQGFYLGYPMPPEDVRTDVPFQEAPGAQAPPA